MKIVLLLEAQTINASLLTDTIKKWGEGWRGGAFLLLRCNVRQHRILPILSYHTIIWKSSLFFIEIVFILYIDNAVDEKAGLEYNSPCGKGG